MTLEDTWKDITDALGQNHVPEIFLVVMGLLVIAIAAMYLKDKEGMAYKGVYIASFVLAAITVVLVATKALPMELGPMIILCLACFTVLARPFREAHIALFIGLFVLVFVYIILDGITGVEFLEGFWVKFIIALIAAGLVYFITSFIEGVVMLFGKLLNWWPLMICVGAICIIEAAMIASGNGSIASFFAK